MARGGRREGAGRPAGVPNKVTAPLKDMARQHTEAALTTLVSILAGGEGIPAAAQVAAAKELLDRGYGKATQHIAGDDDAPPVGVSIIELVGVRPGEG